MVADLENRLGLSTTENARLGNVVSGLVGVQAENTALQASLANAETLVANQQVANENLRRSMEQVTVVPAPVVPAPVLNPLVTSNALLASRVGLGLYGSRVVGVNPLLGSVVRK